jgi:hypothetical protein
MVATARRAGASANFAGSGGAITGICESEEVFKKLESAFEQQGIRVIRPDFAPAVDAAVPLAAGK